LFLFDCTRADSQRHRLARRLLTGVAGV